VVATVVTVSGTSLLGSPQQDVAALPPLPTPRGI
jgi:hypothetical protein